MKNVLFIIIMLFSLSGCKKSSPGTSYTVQPPLNIVISNLGATSGYTIKAQNFTQNSFDFNVTGTQDKTYPIAVNKGDHLNIFYTFVSQLPGQTQKNGEGQINLIYNGSSLGTGGNGEGNISIVIPK